jgi:Mg2+ and Co2+ transporter CorA
VVAISRLDLRQPETIRVFKRSIRQTMEIFLRFTHRYWFHTVSDQAQAQDLFTLWSHHLRTDALYGETRAEIQDMTHYLDSDQVRRQADTVVRLTVVTILALVVNIATGYFGMNLIAAADSPLSTKIAYFLLVFIPVLAFILYAIAKSKRLSDFLDAMSDERLGRRQKLGVLLDVWKQKRTEFDRGRNNGQ